MEQGQLEKFRAWFNDYVGSFYGDDKFVNVSLKLKEDHSHRVCEEMMYLGGKLGLTENQKRIGYAIALFHDIGRFEQFVRYRTYNDSRSENHCLLAIDVLCREKVLADVEGYERELIERAIEYHSRKELPRDLDGEYLLLSKMIRDADKVDIYYVVTGYYKLLRDNPEEFELELEFPDEPEYSAEVIEMLMRGQRIDYGGLRTLNDAKLCQLGWIYDVNFTATLERIKERGFLEKIFDFLPDTEDIKMVRGKVFEYINSRIESDRR